MTNKNTAEYLIAHTDKFYERKEELVWLTVGKQDVDKRLGFETSDDDWDTIFELLKLKVEQELDILIEDSIESIFGV